MHGVLGSLQDVGAPHEATPESGTTTTDMLATLSPLEHVEMPHG